MRFFSLFLSTLFLLTVQTASCQQWAGATTTAGLSYRDGNILVGDNTFRLNIGAGDRAMELIGNNAIFDTDDIMDVKIVFHMNANPLETVKLAT